MKISFKDHFSFNSENYNKFRPEYPDELFKYLASLTTNKSVAIDCATGTGQAAIGLSRYFNLTIGIDGSLHQLNSARRHNKIYYLNSLSENIPIRNNSVDLITVSQALHWFDINTFFKETERILCKEGILAIWIYNLLSISSEINEILFNFYSNTLNNLWPKERILVDNDYKNIIFPFTRIDSPSFQMITEWNLQQLIGYVSTWSAVKRFIDKNNFSPISILQDELKIVWKSPEEKKIIYWPLKLFVRQK